MAETSTRLRVRVSPGAGKAEIVGRHGEAWKLRVTAPPEGGRANEAVLRLLADALAVPRADLKLVSGHAAREKTIVLEGLSAAQTDRRLASATKETRTERRA